MRNLIRLYIGLVLILIVIGLLVVFNASGYLAAKHNSPFHYYFNMHLIKVLIGLGLMIIAAIVPYKYYRQWSKPALLATVFLLIVTILFATRVKGAVRWINLGLIRFQPSELAKLVLIIHLANMLVSKGEKVKSISQGLLYMIFWVVVIGGLVFLQPNVSLSIIIFITAFVLLYVGGASFKHLVSLSIPIFLFGGTFAMLFHHSRRRIIMFYESFAGGKPVPQVLQANIALGSGGAFGVGLGQSRQSDGFVPEAYGDFIFSILGEELGFVGSVLILFIYLALFVIGIIIAKRVADKFAQLLVFGISFGILLGAFVNAAVVTGVAPTTGITLPFISYGGTSLIIGCISVGIVVNIALQEAKLIEVKVLGN